MPDTPPPRPPASPARRWTFTLRTLLLFGVIVVLATSHLVTTWRLKQSTEEIGKLREELGYLNVVEESRIHAVQVLTVESLQWNWRLHLPPGRRYSLHIVTRNIPGSGLPDAGSWTFNAPDEPMTLTVALRKDHLGQWQAVAGDPAGTMRMGIPDADARWLLQNDGYSSSGVAGEKTQSFDPGKPVELLRLRVHQKGPGGISSEPSGPCQGLLIWLREE